jgi:hypothetical protein
MDIGKKMCVGKTDMLNNKKKKKTGHADDIWTELTHGLSKYRT